MNDSEPTFEILDKSDERVTESEIFNIFDKLSDSLNPDLINEIWHNELFTPDYRKELEERFEKEEGKPVPDGLNLFEIRGFSKDEYEKNHLSLDCTDKPEIVIPWLTMLKTASKDAVEAFGTKDDSNIVGIYVRMRSVLMFKFPSKTPGPRKVLYASRAIPLPNNLAVHKYCFGV